MERSPWVRTFDAELVKKATTQEWVRQSIIPKLIGRQTTTERSLRVLHYASTYGVQNQEALPQNQRYREVIETSGLAQGRSGKEIRRLTGQIANHEHPTIRITLPPAKGRGIYRLMGQIEEGKDGLSFTRNLWRYRAIRIFTRNGERAYVAPQRDVDHLMHSLGQAYDALENQGDDPVDVALRLAFFYTVGNNLIHPFLDGNHRAFDRFLEYGLTKANIPFNLPQDQTGNIPYEETFRILTANFILNFLNQYNLQLSPNNIDPTTYQQKLVDALENLIGKKLDDPFFRYAYAGIAGALLSWTPNNQAKKISNIQNQAMHEGGFTVLTRRD